MNHEGVPRMPLAPASDPAIEAAIASALARTPVPAIPADFAANVARRAVAQAPPQKSIWLGWGPRLMIGSAAVLTGGMFALAPHAAPSWNNVAFDGELLLLAELGGLLFIARHLLSRD